MGIRFNGTHSDDVGICVRTVSFPYIAPKIQTKISVPGRDGEVVVEGNYKNVKIEVSCNLYDTDPTTRRKKSREVALWLSSKGELILDSEADMVYTVIACNHDILAEPRGYELPVDDFTIIFECYPHPKNTYYNDSVSWEDMDSTWMHLDLTWDGYEQTFDVVSGDVITLYNLGTFEVKPIITIFGTASNVTVGGFTFINLNGLVTIDCDSEVVYSGSGESIVNQLHNFSGTFPILNPGENTFSISGNISDLTIVFDYKNTYL